MRLRLLALFTFLLLIQTSLAWQSQTATGEACPVTNASDHTVIPPWPYPTVPDSGRSWFGTDRLWVALPEDGTWRGYRQKMQWWRQGYDYHTEPEPKLKITGKRLDAPAPPLMAKIDNVAGSIPSIMAGLDFPALGCWQITGDYESDELTFVVWVAPSMSESERWTEEQQKDYLARAEGGDANAQFWLGEGYEQGWFGKADFQEAFKWLSRAAVQGNPDGQFGLGQMYENGEGMQQDYARAAYWYRKSSRTRP